MSIGGEWLLMLDDKEAILKNGSDIKIALKVPDVSWFLERAGALF